MRFNSAFKGLKTYTSSSLTRKHVLLTLPIPNSVTHHVDPIHVCKRFFCMSWFSSILIPGCYNVSFPFCICTRLVSLISFILYLDSNQCYIFSPPCTRILNSALSTLLLPSMYLMYVTSSLAYPSSIQSHVLTFCFYKHSFLYLLSSVIFYLYFKMY
jgi:hypothetical protein